MKKIILLFAGLYLFSCASSIPSWYTNIPDKKGHRYAVGTEKGDELQNAQDEAREIAVRALAQQMQTEMSGNMKRAQEEINDRAVVDNFRSMQENVFSIKIGDYRVSKQKIVKEKGLFRVYVLVEYDERAAQKRLLDQIKSNKELHEAMRTTELYEEMEREVAEFRARNQ
jgi:hypothetical protein